MKIARWLVVGYLVLLALSHLVRRLPSESESPEPKLQFVTVATEPRGSENPVDIPLAYREWWDRSSLPDAPTIVLLHGSPGSSSDFENLGPELSTNLRVISLDLPGFGASQIDVPDYSIRSHAGYTLQLLDQLGVESAHLVGFGMGGGVALELITRAPAKARSLTLLSAIGVQELELLGNYHLNHAVHGFQLGAIWLCRELIPHFGRLDGFFFGVPYARNFYDSDQRPLRLALESLQLPTLIVHGRQDILVPLAAAQEHHRIVPQSELVLFDASHFMDFRGEIAIAVSIGQFIGRVEADSALFRSQAESARQIAAAAPFDPSVIPEASGITLLVLVGLIAIATLLTEDFACLGAGLLVAQGRIGFLSATFACFVAIVVGNVLLYWAGRYLGRPWLPRAPLKWLVSPEKIDHATSWFERRGDVVVFLTRFIPGTRVAAYFTAGLMNTGLWRFLFYFTLAVAIWTPLLVGLAAYFGNRVFEHFTLFQRYSLPVVIGVLLLVWSAAKLLPQLYRWSGRRQLKK